eukprot:CAMPEP_0183711846 /NCGR_PEP_ID=MMETSP0737-20130205/7213_1 /TAXON_ID=385413 /ORGANISM="Thalassiosira miniscula, Strain CCMP1093" /LENGTH=546 /DNA_ID=CAMNT_0025940413 /DNA_START=116 /DNA_END=1756 /DNA_ORIENTATION=+
MASNSRREHAGLQFNPEEEDAIHQTRPVGSPARSLNESQEIMVGNAGEAIVLGDEADVESDNRNNAFATDSSTAQSKKNGVCPLWLRRSSSKTKGLLCLTIISFLAFVAVMIVGVLKLSPDPSPENNGGVSSAQNTAGGGDGDSSTTIQTTGVPVSTPSTTTPGPTSPAPTTAMSSSPTPEIMTIPIIKSEVKIMLPNALENKVPNFADGLNTQELQHWGLIETQIERSITASLAEDLPKEYSIDSTTLESFNGFVTSAIRTRNSPEGGQGGVRLRHLQNNNNLQSIHKVSFSSSVTVFCLESDCTTASDIVIDAADYLSRRKFVRVSFATDAPTAAATIGTEPPTLAALMTNTGEPTKRPTAVATPAPMITPLPTREITAEPTNEPTERPTPQPTEEPSTAAPTELPPLDDSRDDCNEYTPCERCQGACSSHEDCDEGLYCYNRRGYDYIPGCEGPGKPSVNYCYNPLSDGLTEDKMLSSKDEECYKKDRCGQCRGDCDTDDDCEKDLVCFRRYFIELVPGCAGQGEDGMDYCFDLDDLENFVEL